MAFDPGLADRIREVLRPRRHIAEKTMFGGLAFLDRGNMCCGVVGAELLVRVGPDAHETALALPHARPMDFTGKPMRGFVFVGPAGFASAGDLDGWVARALAFTRTLPAK